MKKILTIFIVFIMVMSVLSVLAACGGDTSSSSPKVQFTVNFYDENGKMLDSRKWDKDAIPSFDYVKQNTDEWRYTVVGWACTLGGEVVSPLPKVTADASYYAVVNKTAIVPEINFGDGASDVEDIQSIALSALKEKFDVKTANISSEQKEKAEFLYKLCQIRINALSGSPAEVKIKANKIYAEMCEALTGITYVCETFEDVKEQTLVQLDVIYAGLKDIFGNVSQAVESAYTKAKAAIQQAVGTLENRTAVEDALEQFKTIAEEAVLDELESKLGELIASAKAEIDVIVRSAIEKIENEQIKSVLTEFVTKQKEATDKIPSLEEAQKKIEEIKSAVIEKIKTCTLEQIEEWQTALKDNLDKTVSATLAKIDDEELRTELQAFYNAEVAKMEAIDSIDTAKATLAEISSDTIAKAQEIADKQLAKLKKDAKAALDEKVSAALANIDDGELRTELQDFYNKEIAKIEAVDSLDTAKATLSEISSDTIAKAQEIAGKQLSKLKKDAKAALDEKVSAVLANIDDEELRAELQVFYNAEVAKMEAIDSIDTAKATLSEISSDTIAKAQEIAGKQLAKLKKEAKAALDEKVSAVLANIDDEELRGELQDFYNKEIAKIEAVDSLDTAKASLAEISSDTIAKAQEIAGKQLAKLKKDAREQLDTIVAKGMDKLDDQTLKKELNDFYEKEIQKVEDIDSLDGAKATVQTIITDTQNLAKELAARKIAELKETVKGYVSTLFGALDVSAYDYIPKAMSPAYAANVVVKDSLVTDYSSDFVAVASINYGGFGAQWNMVVDNINKIDWCCKALSGANSVMSAALIAANDYLSSKYSDTIDTDIENDNYALKISYAENALTVFVQYKTNIENSQFGSVKPTVELVYDIEHNTKTVYIKLSDTNAVRYVVSPNKFEFALCLGAESGSVTSYCVIEKKNDVTEGKIYEFLTVGGKDIKSAAEFYIGDTYVSVIGNKADSLKGFKGYVCELYNKNFGKLLGFEVQETLSFAGVEGTYHTLWFNLSDVSGINSVKVTEKTKGNNSGKSENDTYLNGSDSLLAPTYNTKPIVGKTSRKYDIEMKLRYFYSVNAETGEVEKIEVQVPMLFIQEDNDKDRNFSDYPADMLKDNNINSTVTMDSIVLDKVMSEYDTRIDEFIQNKENMSSADVKEFIG